MAENKSVFNAVLRCKSPHMARTGGADSRQTLPKLKVYRLYNCGAGLAMHPIDLWRGPP
jgi:hypothetical protein